MPQMRNRPKKATSNAAESREEWQPRQKPANNSSAYEPDHFVYSNLFMRSCLSLEFQTYPPFKHMCADS